jgi:hypothetical protein
MTRRWALELALLAGISTGWVGMGEAQECETYADCGPRQNCFSGTCDCISHWGTAGPDCTTPTLGSYYIIGLSVGTALIHLGIGLLNCIALRDHMR